MGGAFVVVDTNPIVLGVDTPGVRSDSLEGGGMARPSLYGRHRLRVLGLIDQAARAHAAPPSVRELANSTGVGVATMHLYLKKLAEEGLIEWQSSKHRSLRCTPLATPLLSS